MKCVILAGGLGTRLSEETERRPKPMVEIGDHPILWHIMKIYESFGVDDFVICLGYRGYVIKEYFANYMLHASDVTVDLGKNTIELHEAKAERWRVTLVDTGLESMTGGRLRRVRDHVRDETFCFTYGDAVGDVDVAALIEHHRRSGRMATVTAVQPPGRWGVLQIEEDLVRGFQEKPMGDGGWVNGGFFVLEPGVLDLIDDDATPWEAAPMERLIASGDLAFYRHQGFWQPMDTLRDKQQLQRMWDAGRAPWRCW